MIDYINSEAYKKIQEAKEHLNKAYECLHVVLSKNTDGHDQMKDAYVDRIRRASAAVYDAEKSI